MKFEQGSNFGNKITPDTMFPHLLLGNRKPFLCDTFSGFCHSSLHAAVFKPFKFKDGENAFFKGVAEPLSFCYWKSK